MTRSSSLKPFLMFREDVQYSGKWGLIDISLSIPTCCFFVLRSCLLLFDPGQRCGVKHVRRLNLYPKNVLSRLWSLFGSLIWVLNVNGLNFWSLSLQLSANRFVCELLQEAFPFYDYWENGTCCRQNAAFTSFVMWVVDLRAITDLMFDD